jgi:drug/metabolite transporter (DMT)-like permease
MLNLIVVYLVWGSTYLFIRLTVQEGSGFPPFAMAASRTLCASAILFILAVVFGHRLWLPGPELRVLIASGLLLWVGGNGWCWVNASPRRPLWEQPLSLSGFPVFFGNGSDREGDDFKGAGEERFTFI